MDTLTASEARHLFLGAQGLLANPERRVTPAGVHAVIERLGFVQVDTISVVARAHHHILLTRLDGYRPAHLTTLLERDRKLFEHWTHDASVIPSAWYPFWKHRFDRYWKRDRSTNKWWTARMGDDPDGIMAHVLERISVDGPRMSRDFEHVRRGDKGSAWWNWKPAKAALEHLWRSGRLAVRQRVNFHKVYDLPERVFPDLHRAPAPDPDAHLHWAAHTALERIGCGTAAEIAGFYRAVSSVEMSQWCRAAADRGELEPLRVETEDGSAPRTEYALAGWRRAASRYPDPPQRLRIMSPFDPILRDRKRALRRFGFDYRFEAFVPAPKRRYGYYVLPVLDGDRFVARLDSKLHRKEGELEVLGLWWEPGVRVTRARRTALRDALERFAKGLGAERVRLTAS